MLSHKPFKVKTKTITFDDVIGEQVKQVVVRGVIDLVKHNKIPVTQIIDVFAAARILNQRIVDGKIIFDGEVSVKVLYEGKAPDQPVLVAEITLRFSDFVDIEGALPTDRLSLTVAIEDVTAKVLTQTTIQVTVVLAVTVRVTREVEKEVVIDVFGPKEMFVKKRLLKLRRVLAEGTRQVLLREIQSLKKLKKPPFAQLIDIFSTARITDVRVIADKVLFEGVVDIKILYATPGQQVVVVSQQDTFSDMVELPGALPGMEVEISAVVELVTVTAEDRTGDGLNDTLVKTIVVKVTARVFEALEIKVVVDVKGLPHLALEKQTVRVEDLVGIAETQIILRERLDTRRHCKPCVVQIIDCRAFPRITEVRVITDKVVVLGRVEIKVIYEAKGQTVHVLRGEFPFQGFSDVPGALPGQTQFTTVRVLDTTCVIAPDLPPDQVKCPPVDATVVLVATTRLVATRQLEVVVKVAEDIQRVEGINRGVVTADRVNVRSGPSTTFPVIAQVKRGTKVIILAEVGEWFKVFIPALKIEGFIFRRFVRVEKPLG